MQVSLREWTAYDAPALQTAINNKSVQDNLRDGIPFPYSIGDAEEFIAGVLSADKDMQYLFAIIYENVVVGNIGVYRKDNIHRFTGELGYYIAQPHWGKGIVTEAVKQICSYIFKNTDIVRIFAEPFVRNMASCRVLEKAGFSLEGTLRKNAYKNGTVEDMKIYSIIK